MFLCVQEIPLLLFSAWTIYYNTFIIVFYPNILGAKRTDHVCSIRKEKINIKFQSFRKYSTIDPQSINCINLFWIWVSVDTLSPYYCSLLLMMLRIRLVFAKWQRCLVLCWEEVKMDRSFVILANSVRIQRPNAAVSNLKSRLITFSKLSQMPQYYFRPLVYDIYCEYYPTL